MWFWESGAPDGCGRRTSQPCKPVDYRCTGLNKFNTDIICLPYSLWKILIYNFIPTCSDITILIIDYEGK